MNKSLEKYSRSTFGQFVLRHQKYAPVFVFMGGFIFDTLTLGRIDRTYDTVVLCLHMSFLSLWIYLYNSKEDLRWLRQYLGRFTKYLPLAIQFSFGGLSSAFVIYFFRSVSLSKTMAFFVLLLLLLLANELLKKRISNKYLQFGIYFFISFTFFAFMIPMLIKQMNTFIFILSGLISLLSVLSLVLVTFKSSTRARSEVNLTKLFSILFSIYIAINLFYYFSLIPPVPLAMQTGLVAHHVEKQGEDYLVSYEKDDWYVFWRTYRSDFHRRDGEAVYAFTSIFAPTELSKAVYHRWQWLDPKTDTWKVTEDIGFKVTGGRDLGFRGYTYKENIWPGQWKVEVITEEELVIGVLHFDIKTAATAEDRQLIQKTF